MPRVPSPEPPELKIKVRDHFSAAREAALKESVWVDYTNGQQLLWNGTVYTYEVRMSDGRTKSKVFAFQMRDDLGVLTWHYCPQCPRTPTPERAVADIRTKIEILKAAEDSN